MQKTVFTCGCRIFPADVPASAFEAIDDPASTSHFYAECLECEQKKLKEQLEEKIIELLPVYKGLEELFNAIKVRNEAKCTWVKGQLDLCIFESFANFAYSVVRDYAIKWDKDAKKDLGFLAGLETWHQTMKAKLSRKETSFRQGADNTSMSRQGSG
ncbi:hypothetical protein VTN77DRAFT_2674 [Rasamsonia byssochlamydoides]|uniref:uncharacterized protein n=1 Tax=Rasamsonia byssochlamydoides TaxID=89139 RepID=UPI00374213E8